MFSLAGFRRLALLTAAMASAVRAANLGERQNPSFITALPTAATDSIVVITVTPSPTIPPARPNPPAQFTSISAPPSQQTPAPGLTPAPSTPSVAAGLATSVNAVEGPYYGGVPMKSPDIHVSSFFLVLFVLGATVHGVFYQRSSKRSRQAPRNAISGLLVCFCLARVITCAFRLGWAVASTSTAVNFLALVSENAGTILLFLLNFHLAKRMVGLFNIQLSLWARAVVDSCLKISVLAMFAVIFLLNTIGVASFEFKSSNLQDATTETSLVQTSAALLFVLGLAFVGSVILVRVSADRPRIDRLTAKTTIFLVGAGLLTMSGHLIRMVATFFIWKPIVGSSTPVILSKAIYYSTGFGFEILIIVLYAVMRVDLLFTSPVGPTLNTPLRRSETPAGSQAVAVSEAPLQLRMNPILTGDGHDGRYGPWAQPQDSKYSPARVESRQRDHDSASTLKERVEEAMEAGELGPEDWRSSKNMFIAIHRTFSVSSKRLSALTQSSRG